MSKEKFQARVLVGSVIAGFSVQANDLVEGSAELINEYVKTGTLDKSKASVSYCIKNNAKPIDLEPKEIPDEVTDEMLVEAIKSLDKENAELWTSGGSPTTAALEAVIGVKIKAADRDAAWKIVLEESAGEDSENETTG